jgi:3-oxoadipate enol-lactonase
VLDTPSLPFGQTVIFSAVPEPADAAGTNRSVAATARMMRIDARLHSARLPALILLHGLGTGPSGWSPQIEAFSGTEVIAPSHVAAEGMLDRLDPPFDVCGLSLGALVALRYAGERPERVRRLVVCAGFARLPPHLRLLQLALAMVVRALPSSLVRRGLVSAVPEAHRQKARDETAWIDARQASRIMRAGASYRLERLPPMPTLVLCGDRDRVNLGLSRKLAEALPNATFATVPNAGHVANLDNPEAFNALLRDFLDN